MKSKLKKLEEEYQKIHPIAERFSIEICDQLNQLLTEQNISLSIPIQLRVKSLSSISEKVERKSLKINTLKELNDLVGIRLILQFTRDVNKVCDLIFSNFNVLEQDNTQERQKEDQFGYSSIHFIVEPPESWLTLPTLRNMTGIRAEIQVRTTAQHIWASASHTLQYKREESIPPSIRRAIYRVSALLETVDLEFERVLAERDGYLENINTSSSDEILNVDLLAKILDTLLPPQNKKEGAEDYDELLRDLNQFNINTSNDLSELITSNLRVILDEDKIMVKKNINNPQQRELSGATPDRLSKNVFFTHMGLTREAMNLKFGEDWDSYIYSKSDFDE